VLFNHVLNLNDQLPILREPILPCGEMVKQGLWAIVGVPNTGIIAVSRSPIRAIPLHDPSGKGASVREEVVNVGLLIFPELGRSMLADGVDESIGMEHTDCLA
jgi:hypothetical protein